MQKKISKGRYIYSDYSEKNLFRYLRFNNIFATQFHPEKVKKMVWKLSKNFIKVE